MPEKNTPIRIVWIVNDLYINNFITVYRECQKRSELEMIVVAVPHFEFAFSSGSSADEVYDYLVKEGIDCVHCWNKETENYIDISSFEPDYIFTTTPYDIYLPESYRSNKLMQIAKLCNVEYGAVICKRTGMYKDVGDNPYLANCWMTFTTGEQDSKQIYERYTPIGNLKLDEYLYYGRDGSKSGKWHVSADAANMLKVVWKPRWTAVKEDSNLMVYLEDFYQYVEDNGNIDFVMLAHPFLIANASYKGYGEALTAVLQKMNELPNFRLEDGSDFLDCVLSADVLISDHSSTLAEFAVTGKPIIYTPTEVDLNDLGKSIVDLCYQAFSFSEISEKLNNLKTGLDPLKLKREQKKDSYFFCPPNGMSSAKYLLQFLINDYSDLNSRKQYSQLLYKLNQEEKKKIESDNKILSDRLILSDTAKTESERKLSSIKEEKNKLEQELEHSLTDNAELTAKIKELSDDLSKLIASQTQLLDSIKAQVEHNRKLMDYNHILSEKLIFIDNEIAEAEQKNRTLSLENEALADERNSLVNERNALIKDKEDILNSTSWKITRPLRAITRRVRALLRRK